MSTPKTKTKFMRWSLTQQKRPANIAKETSFVAAPALISRAQHANASARLAVARAGDWSAADPEAGTVHRGRIVARRRRILPPESAVLAVLLLFTPAPPPLCVFPDDGRAPPAPPAPRSLAESNMPMPRRDSRWRPARCRAFAAARLPWTLNMDKVTCNLSESNMAKVTSNMSRPARASGRSRPSGSPANSHPRASRLQSRATW